MDLGRTALSIVIPAYNEERTIEKTVTHIIEHLQTRRICADVIIVDDGSEDRTGKIADKLSEQFQCIQYIRLLINSGKGYAVKEGIFASRGEYILFSDADLSTPIAQIDKLLLPLQQGYDIAIASRRLPESSIEIPQPLLRRISGRVFGILTKLVLVRGIQDTQCGFKAFRREAAKILFSKQQIKRFGFDVELLYLAQKLRFKVKEVPVCWGDSTCSSVKLTKDSLCMLLDLLSIRLNYILGRYR